MSPSLTVLEGGHGRPHLTLVPPPKPDRRDLIHLDRERDLRRGINPTGDRAA